MDLPVPPPVAPSLLIKIVSITERLDFGNIFPKSQRFEIELGSGDGSFLVNYARLHPQRNFLGVERLLGRLRKLERKARRAGLENLRGVRIESAYFLEYLVPPESLSALHIYFPDPWPKRKHRKYRLINERFTQIARAALAADGVVYLRTDDADYFAQMTTVFSASIAFKHVETPDELSGVITDFERTFQSRGVKTLRAAYQKTS